MKILVIGAHGGIGKRVIDKLNNNENFEPTALIRKQKQSDYFKNKGVSTIVESIENSVEKIGEAITGFDAIVFSAGSGGSTGDDKTLTVDLDGAVKVMKAAENKGVKRMVMVSAAYADDREVWDQTGLKPYYVAKHFADQTLRQSKLDYTILRPTGLTDEEGTGKIAVREQSSLNNSIPRDDVAQAIIEVLKNKNSIGKTYEISSGDKAVEEMI